MRKINLDPLSGHVSIDDTRIAPLHIIAFLSFAESLIVDKNNHSAEHDVISYTCGKVMLRNYFFEVEVFYDDSVLQGLSLNWSDGITKIKGWDSSFSDLIHDKASLTRLVKKVIGRDADKKEDFEDIFEFEWGSIAVKGVRILMHPVIDIFWKGSAK